MAFNDATFDRITAQAREISFSRVALTAIAAFFFALGWVTARVFTLLWFAIAWSATAVKVGWEEGRKSAKRR